MTRYHANTDSDKKESFNDAPSEKEMSKYKDFGKLKYNYERMTRPIYKRPIYRYRKGFLIILLVLLVLWLIMEFG
jgi:hypothetical protein